MSNLQSPISTNARCLFALSIRLTQRSGRTTMTIQTDARERVLEAAERLFARKGYTTVTLRDIASEVGIKHASLYHHVPGGKEELFIEVTKRNLQSHKAGLQEAIASAGPGIRTQLYAIADWLLSHPPMDLVRMAHSDLPAIEATKAAEISFMAFEALIIPVEQALQRAQQNGEIVHHDLGLVAGGLVGMLESLHAIPIEQALLEGKYLQTLANTLIDVMLDGIHQP